MREGHAHENGSGWQLTRKSSFSRTLTLALLLIAPLSHDRWCSGQLTHFWLSSSDSISAVGEVPTLTLPLAPGPHEIYLWGRPKPGRTLDNWILNLRSDSPAIVIRRRVTVRN